MVVKRAADVRLVVFACEAGMGSSLIGANQLKKKLGALGRDIKVTHSPVNLIPADTDVVVGRAVVQELHEQRGLGPAAQEPAGGRGHRRRRSGLKR